MFYALVIQYNKHWALRGSNTLTVSLLRNVSFKAGLLLDYTTGQVGSSTSYIFDNLPDVPDLVGTSAPTGHSVPLVPSESSLIAWDHLLIHPSLLLRSDIGEQTSESETLSNKGKQEKRWPLKFRKKLRQLNQNRTIV